MDCGSFNGTILTKLVNIKEQLTNAFIFGFLCVNEFTAVSLEQGLLPSDK